MISTPERTDAFTYDALGNRVGLNYVASRGQMNILRRDNGLNQYVSWATNYPTNPVQWGAGIFHDDNLTAPTPPWVWPENGVTMADGLITASYNALNQPVAIYSPALPVGNFLWLGFDPLGRCVKRWLASASGGAATTNPATYFYYDGWNMTQEGVNANAPGRVYVHGARVDEIVASCVWSGNQWAYHHYDARGHCILLTLANANIQEKYEYDAFGQPYFYNASGTPLPKVNNRPLSAWGNRFLFTGREWLGEVGLYDYRNRMYQPELGRFMQPDPIQFKAGDYNLYRYCHNDPINRVDPFGLEDIKLELKKTGDRNQHVNEIIGEKGNRLSGKTEASFKVHPGEKQQDGSTKVTGEMKVDAKYADSAGPKTKAETAKLEPEHAVPFDRFFKQAEKTVEALNRRGFDSSGAAEKALEGSLRRKFNEAYAESLRLDRPRELGGRHQLPFKYEE